MHPKIWLLLLSILAVLCPSAAARAQPFQCIDVDLVTVDGTADVLEDSVTINRPGVTSGALVGTNVEFSCGPCSDATFEDVVTQIAGPTGLICGYTSQVPVNLVRNRELVCARSTISGRKWEIGLRSWLGSNGLCVDADLGASCAQATDLSSYSRCEFRRGIPVHAVDWGTLKIRFE